VGGSIEQLDGLRSHLLHSELSPKTLEIGLLAPTTLEIGLGVDVIEMALIENEWLAVACAGSQARVFVDVGCNLGWFSMLALAYRCDIVCVEPNPHLIAAIVCSAFLNRFTGSIIVVQAAAGAGAAVMELNIAIRHFGLSTLDRHHRTQHTESDGSQRRPGAGSGTGGLVTRSC
jgi:hypothetical protein